MRVLALETSAKSVSCAVTENGAVLAHSFQCTGLTHSRTLLPMVSAMLENAELPLGSMDLFAVAAGPGSFTGLRIGVSALKGLSWAQDKPCVGVSALNAMAQNLAHTEALIVCAMDARRSQVYNALFLAHGGGLERLSEDRAIGLDELADELRDDSREKLVVGDGAALAWEALSAGGVACTLAPSALRYQNAVGVALCAEQAALRGEAINARELSVFYLRPPQAERVRGMKAANGPQ